MLVEFIDKLISLAPPAQISGDNGQVYTSRSVHPLQTPKPDALEVKTLTGYLAALKSIKLATPADVLSHVEDHDKVVLLPQSLDKWNRRSQLVVAICEANRFTFGQFHEPEQFVIALQTMFQSAAGDDLPNVLKLCSNLSTEAVNIAADDGVSQQVSTRQGVVLKNAPQTVNPRVSLTPYRTFREVDQPCSEFLLRFRSRPNQTPLVALFEADGGEWKREAMENIGAYLAAKAPEIPVIA